MTARTHDIGDQVRISGVFTNAAGTATDPTTVTLKLLRPDGTVTTLVYLTDVELVRDSAGNYHADVIPVAGENGIWWFRWAATGAVQAADEQAFFVRPSRFA